MDINLELVEVITVDNECRHQFTAKVADGCGLEHVYFKFGKETGALQAAIRTNSGLRRSAIMTTK